MGRHTSRNLTAKPVTVSFIHAMHLHISNVCLSQSPPSNSNRISASSKSMNTINLEKSCFGSIDSTWTTDRNGWKFRTDQNRFASNYFFRATSSICWTVLVEYCCSGHYCIQVCPQHLQVSFWINSDIWENETKNSTHSKEYGRKSEFGDVGAQSFCLSFCENFEFACKVAENDDAEALNQDRHQSGENVFIGFIHSKVLKKISC